MLETQNKDLRRESKYLMMKPRFNMQQFCNTTPKDMFTYPVWDCLTLLKKIIWVDGWTDGYMNFGQGQNTCSC